MTNPEGAKGRRMTRPLTDREAAETIEQFGDDLCKLMRAFDNACNRMDSDTIARVNAIPDQDKLDTVAEDFRKLGDELCRGCDERDEADPRRAMINVGGHRDGANK